MGTHGTEDSTPNGDKEDTHLLLDITNTTISAPSAYEVSREARVARACGV